MHFTDIQYFHWLTCCFSLPIHLPGPSTSDGESLHWRTPKLISPLVQDRSGFISKNIELGVEAQLLDEATWSGMGYRLVEDENVLYASVPFAAPGGYRGVCIKLLMYVS